jgi:citrate synthase
VIVRIRNLIEWYGIRERAWDLINKQSIAIMELRWLREQEQLAYARNTRDLITHFRDVLDGDDHEAVRDALDAALVDLSDHVARTEEHFVT